MGTPRRSYSSDKRYVCKSEFYGPRLLTGLGALEESRRTCDSTGLDSVIRCPVDANYDNPTTKVLKLSVTPDGPFYEANFKEVAAQTCPLSRVIWMFANKAPGSHLNPVLEEFLKFLRPQAGVIWIRRGDDIRCTAGSAMK